MRDIYYGVGPYKNALELICASHDVGYVALIRRSVILIGFYREKVLNEGY